MTDYRRPRIVRNLLEKIPRRRRRIYGLLLVCMAVMASLKPAAVLAIGGYQRFISPYKGYRCAYGALYGGPSCSEFGKRSIRQYGLIGGLILLRERFQACHEAAEVLHGGTCRPTGPRAEGCFESDRERGKREGKESREYCTGCAEGCCSK